MLLFSGCVGSCGGCQLQRWCCRRISRIHTWGVGPRADQHYRRPRLGRLHTQVIPTSELEVILNNRVLLGGTSIASDYSSFVRTFPAPQDPLISCLALERLEWPRSLCQERDTSQQPQRGWSTPKLMSSASSPPPSSLMVNIVWFSAGKPQRTSTSMLCRGTSKTNRR